jgi:predicted XRE-type DNA-binding protein
VARSARLDKMAKRPLSERFFEKISETQSLIFWGGKRCHEWTGCLMKNGYGQINVDGRAGYAHRVSWELHNGPIPQGLFILHRCDNRKCVNPDHLQLGTFMENMEDMVAKKRQAAGMKNSHAKLDDDAIRLIRSSDLKQKELADMFGVTQPTISEVQSGKIWRLVEKI